MWQLSAFADEIGPEFGEQCALVAELGIGFLDLRSAWETNILDCDQKQLAEIEHTLREHGLEVASIASPIGKISLEDDFGLHLEELRLAVEIANRFGTKYVRVFSFFVPSGVEPSTHRDEIVQKMSWFADVAEAANIVLLHENDKGTYGDNPARCLDVIESVDSSHLRATWDPANFVQVGATPFTDGYRLLRPYLVQIHIKDAISATGQVVPAGYGKGQIPETIHALKGDGFDGMFALEPHLGTTHVMGGSSGPELFTSAWRAFVGILEDQGIAFR